jgi:hypothetical protein
MNIQLSQTSSPFPREEAPLYTSTLKTAFLGQFCNLGYTYEMPVKISCGLDPSVFFIGSHISVFKRFFQGAKLPKDGVVVLQDCVRTRNADMLGNVDFAPRWGSFFSSLGALIPYHKLDAICQDSVDLFIKTLQCVPENVIARVSARDKDLLRNVQKLFTPERIELDTKPEKYYRHSIGMPNVAGRNFNIALKDPKTGETNDVGNVIILEKDGAPHAIELALGVSTILKQMYGLDHILDCHPLLLKPDANPKNEGVRRQFEDTVITSTALYREGLRPSNKDMRTRLLKKYTTAMKPLAARIGIGKEGIVSLADDYQTREYWSTCFDARELLN